MARHPSPSSIGEAGNRKDGKTDQQTVTSKEKKLKKGREQCCIVFLT